MIDQESLVSWRSLTEGSNNALSSEKINGQII